MDDDGETIAVLGAGRIAALNTTALAWQAEVSYSTSPDTGAMLITPQAGVSFLQSQVEGSGFFFYSGSELHLTTTTKLHVYVCFPPLGAA